jgi:hypothetical protein
MLARGPPVPRQQTVHPPLSSPPATLLAVRRKSIQRPRGGIDLPENRRIPTIQIRAEVIIVHRKAASYKLFLTNSKSNEGCERPSEMLNGSRAFLPAVDDEGGIVFLPVDSIIMLSMPASWEYRHVGAPLITRDGSQLMTAELNIDLSDAAHIYGTIQYLAPDGRTRIQDYLNRAERFIPLLQADTVVFVNKRHVTRIAPMKGH